MDLLDLFESNHEHYGQYSKELTVREKDGKLQGSGKTVHGDYLGDGAWTEHLAGNRRLGLMPLLPDGTCYWAALDLDIYEYNLQYEKAIKLIQDEWPVVPVRTKSGGLHLYVFFSEAVLAEDAIKLMHKYGKQMGLKYDKTFPVSANPDAAGGWIHVPYYGSPPDSYATNPNGEPLSIDQFVNLATAVRMTAKDLRGYISAKRKDDGWTDQQIPPCIVRMKSEGLPEGGRNQALRHIAILFQKVFRDDDNRREAEIQAANLWFDPPMSPSEVNQILNQARRDPGLKYMCKQSPMCNLCDRSSCMTRKYGISSDTDNEWEITRMVKIDSDPPYYLVYCGDQHVRATSKELLNQRKFRELCLDRFVVLPPAMKQAEWDQYILALCREAEIQEAAAEASDLDQFKTALNFVNESYIRKGQDRSVILFGAPWYDEQNKTVTVRGQVIIDAMRRLFNTTMTLNQCQPYMMAMGITTKQVKLRGTNNNYWVYPVQGDEPWLENYNKDEVF